MTEHLLSQNPFRTCDDKHSGRVLAGRQGYAALRSGRLRKPQDMALATGQTVPGVGRHGSVPVLRAGAKSFTDLGLSQGIVWSRAVPSLKSPEIHPPTLMQGSGLDFWQKNLARLPGTPSGRASWHRMGSTGEHSQDLN